MAIKSINATKLDNDLTYIADLLRERTGTTAELTFPNDFITKIENTTTVDEFASNASVSGPIHLNSATQIAAYSFASMPITEIHAPNVTRFYSNIGSNYTGRCVFYNCANLSIVDFPNLSNVGSGGYLFAKCVSLTNISLPKCNSDQHMFEDCSNLITAHLGGDGATNSYGFANCTSLMGVEYSGEVTTIAANEYNGAINMAILIIRTITAPSLANINAFTNSPFASGKAGGILYVPETLIETYTNATNWSTILAYENNQILPIEESIYETQHIDGILIGG